MATSSAPAQATAPRATASQVIATAQPGTFRPTGSTRVLDSRPTGGLAAARTARFGVAGHGAIPAGAAAVTVNITVLSPARSGSISVFPGDAAWNGAASISYVARQTKQSMITAVLGADGSLAVRNNIGATLEVIADVSGYYDGGTPTVAGSFKAVGFHRIFDTRAAGSHALPPGSLTPVQVEGRGGVPTPAAAVVANLTVIGPGRSGSVSAYANGTEWDGSASVSFAAGRTEQDVLSIGLGSDGAIAIRNNTAVALQVVLDVFGYFLAGTPAEYGSYQQVRPERALDERQAGQPPVQPGGTVRVQPSRSIGPDLVPSWGLPAAVVRISILNPARAGSVSVYRADQGWNGAASISFPARTTVQQQLLVPLGPDQQLLLRDNTGSPLTVLADVLGYYLGVPNPLQPAAYTQFESIPGELQDVSCATATFCMAVEDYGKVETWNGSTWSLPVQVPQADFLSSVSCVSASFCVVAGLDNHRNIELFGFDGTGWTSLAGLAYHNRGMPLVSCPSASFCVATGDGSYRTFDGTGWSAEQTFDLLYVQSLSCPSATFCVASVDRAGQVYSFNGTDWTGPVSIPGMTQVAQSVSCSSASFCLAVGSEGMAATYDGTGWTLSGQLSETISLYSVSCVSSSNCRAVDDDGYILSFDGNSWSAPTTGQNFPTGVISCAASGTCAVISYYDNRAAIFDGTSWSSPPSRIGVQPAGAVAVSCTSASFCMAADAAGYLVRYDGTSWGTPTLINGGGSKLTDLSCAAPSSCIAVDDQGQAYAYDGSSWASPVPVVAGVRLDAVACAGPSFCVAVDTGGQAASYDGSGWSAPVAVSDHPLLDVSCPSSTFCLAVDSAGQAVSYDGSRWSSRRPTGAGYLNQISCADAGFCLATGAGQAARWQNGGWAPLPIAADQYPGPVACPSAQLCVAATPRIYTGSGYLGNPGTIATWDGSEWTMPLYVGFSQVISCPTEVFCMVLANFSARRLTG